MFSFYRIIDIFQRICVSSMLTTAQKYRFSNTHIIDIDNISKRPGDIEWADTGEGGLQVRILLHSSSFNSTEITPV